MCCHIQRVERATHVRSGTLSLSLIPPKVMTNSMAVYDPSGESVCYHQHRIKARHHESPVSHKMRIIQTLPLMGGTRRGNAAYNASKAAIKSLTESLAHELRSNPQANVTAHLFMCVLVFHMVVKPTYVYSPGWTWTGLTAGEADQDNIEEKPAGAWTAMETVQYMLDRVRSGDFYILVPDNETRREVDQLRILWAAGDVVEGRPALSRWHQSYKSMFEEYLREGLA
jgi:NAD(P)-dependent dehydrogenase (short-subunit alcohol dehydrogenase family)